MALINDFVAILALFFGILIIFYTELLAYLIGSFLIIYAVVKIIQIYTRDKR